jgi:hypothetical protein
MLVLLLEERLVAVPVPVAVTPLYQGDEYSMIHLLYMPTWLVGLYQVVASRRVIL